MSDVVGSADADTCCIKNVLKTIVLGELMVY